MNKGLNEFGVACQILEGIKWISSSQCGKECDNSVE